MIKANNNSMIIKKQNDKKTKQTKNNYQCNIQETNSSDCVNN